MFEFFMKGGILMWPILICSIISVSIILERLYYFYDVKRKIYIPEFSSLVKDLLRRKKIADAIKLCEETKGPLSKIILTGIRNHNLSFEERERIVSIVGSREVRNMEKHLNILSLIADISPLLGLTGTVTGLIRAFMKVQEMSGRVDASQLAGGIWEALITTAAGLFVAIPTLAFYHYFEGKVSSYASLMKDVAAEILGLTETKVEKETSNSEGKNA